MYLSPLILLKIRNLHISAPIEGGPAHALRSTRIQDVLVRRRAHRGRAHQRLGRGRRLPPATYLPEGTAPMSHAIAVPVTQELANRGARRSTNGGRGSAGVASGPTRGD